MLAIPKTMWFVEGLRNKIDYKKIRFRKDVGNKVDQRKFSTGAGLASFFLSLNLMIDMIC